ncbi:hypothetical protein OO012_11200 [Rhodobacteraceae bacterium KMM 6894]|nr:hypothetical protein [Rhodobacteraceae bacterium KMM 6894]
MANETADQGRSETVIKVPEAVGVFDSFESFRQAFYDLRMVGFSRYDLSVLGDEDALREKLGSAYLRAEDMEDDPRVPRAAFTSEEAIGELEGMAIGGAFFIPSYIAMAAMAAAGAAASATAAVVAIVGLPAAAIGLLFANRIKQHHKDYYADQIARGGILLWVRVADKEKEKLAVEILKGHSGIDVHVHDWSV